MAFCAAWTSRSGTAPRRSFSSTIMSFVRCETAAKIDSETSAGQKEIVQTIRGMMDSGAITVDIGGGGATLVE